MPDVLRLTVLWIAAAVCAAADPRPDVAKMVQDAIDAGIPLDVRVLFLTTTRDEMGHHLDHKSDIRGVDLVWFCRKYGPITEPMLQEWRAVGYISHQTDLVFYEL